MTAMSETKKAALSGKYAAYPEYKDSGVKWLGNVPSHWIVSKFSYLKTVLTDYTANGSFADLKANVTYLDEPSYARLVRLTDLRHDLNNSNGVWVNEASYKYLNKSALFGGEFLLANVGAYAGLFYQMPFNKGAASLAPNMFMAKFNDSKVSREFMAFVGQSDNISCQLKLSATASSAQPKLNKDDFKSVRFTYPQLKEQIQIAAFLDQETAKIDTLIEKQQQLIELLKEKRQAVISHQVTKGINPDAPMKDSGVEWLGEVPKHWGLPKLIHITTNIGDGLHSTPKYQDNTGYFFVNGNNLVNGKIAIGTTAKEVPESEYHNHYIHLDSSTIFLSINGTIGNVAKYNNEQIILGKSAAYINCTDTISPDYLMLLLRTNEYRRYFDLEVTGTTISNLSLNSIRQMKVCTPTFEEQTEIVKYCHSNEHKYNLLIESAQRAINLMQERRTALISAAVTGKIDVRTWIAPTTSSDENEAAQEVTA